MNPPPDPLVRSALRASAAAGPHPDAEVLGLYAERALDGGERLEVEAHLVACVRCQSIVADLAVGAPEDASAGAADVPGVLGWFTGWHWLMPAASLAAVAAIAVWIGPPSFDRAAGPPSSSLDAQARPAIPPPSRIAQAETPAPAPVTSVPPAPVTSAPQPSARPTADALAAQARRAEPLPTNGAREVRDLARAASAENTVTLGVTRPAQSLADAAAPAAPVQPAVAASAPATAEARAEKAVAAPTAQAPVPVPAAAPASEAMAARRAAMPAAAGAGATAASAGTAAPADRARAGASFRVVAGRIERSTDEGRTWRQATTPQGLRIVAIAEVSTRVAWALAADAVLRTTDGETWTRVSAPPDAPFTSIVAADADHATATTARGLRYDTSDGGATWRRAP